MVTQPQKQFKVLVIGDSCIDKYHYGVCARLSPEAPVPVFKLQYTQKKPGMALNVLSNLSSFDVEANVLSNPKSKITKERFIDIKSQSHLLRFDTGEAKKLEEMDKSLITEDLLEPYDAIAIVDYDKGFIRENSATTIVSTARKLGIPVFVDSKKKNLNPFEGAIIKINELERDSLAAFPENCKLIVTKGAAGAEYRGALYETPEVEAHDVCGAGDTFFAALIYEYLGAQDLPSAISFANRCAGVTVTKTGVYSLTAQDIKNVNLC